jgi:hypothetical protein
LAYFHAVLTFALLLKVTKRRFLAVVVKNENLDDWVAEAIQAASHAA